ncbi:Lipid A biosynthesis protein [Azospirillaceae bacterium]
MNWFHDKSTIDLVWTGIGLFGQLLFSMRFLYQWFKSEQVKRSVVPEAFWYFSLAGGITLLTYAIRQKDLVFVIGQGSGLFIYVRNIVLIRQEKKRCALTESNS